MILQNVVDTVDSSSSVRPALTIDSNSASGDSDEGYQSTLTGVKASLKTFGLMRKTCSEDNKRDAGQQQLC